MLVSLNNWWICFIILTRYINHSMNLKSGFLPIIVTKGCMNYLCALLFMNGWYFFYVSFLHKLTEWIYLVFLTALFWRQSVRRRRKSTSHWEIMPLRRNVWPFFLHEFRFVVGHFSKNIWCCVLLLFPFEFNLSSWNGIISAFVLYFSFSFSFQLQVLYCFNCLFTL